MKLMFIYVLGIMSFFKLGTVTINSIYIMNRFMHHYELIKMSTRIS